MDNNDHRDYKSGWRQIPLSMRISIDSETPECRRGFEAAHSEMWDAIEGDHPNECGWKCWACEVMKAVIEDMLHTLSGIMTEDEFDAMAEILAEMTHRLRGE